VLSYRRVGWAIRTRSDPQNIRFLFLKDWCLQGELRRLKLRCRSERATESVPYAMGGSARKQEGRAEILLTSKNLLVGLFLLGVGEKTSGGHSRKILGDRADYSAFTTRKLGD